MTNPNSANLERIIRLRKIRQMKRRRRNTILTLLVIIVLMLVSIVVLGNKLLDTQPANSVSRTEKEVDVLKASDSSKNAKDKKSKKEDKEKTSKDSKKEENKEEADTASFTKVSADYSTHYCYEKDKQTRYEKYHSQNPSRSVDEVVWQVNANLDKPFYGYDVPVANIHDPLVIVNKYYKVDPSQKPNLISVEGYLMTPATGDAYKRMKSDAAANGLSIQAASTYRSVEYQENLYNSYLNQDPREVVDTYSARAGYSEHHTGMAIDFIGSFGSLNDFENTKEYPWVRDNCHKYGFIIRYTAENQWITGYKNEPWHLRYIGVDAATDMKAKGVSSFEEYKVKYVDHRP